MADEKFTFAQITGDEPMPEPTEGEQGSSTGAEGAEAQEGKVIPSETLEDSKETPEEETTVEKTEEEKQVEQQVDSLLEKGNADPESLTDEEVQFLKDNGVEVEEGTSNVFSEVEEITGNALEVDFGDVDPSSPQGVATYLEAHREAVESSFEQQLKETFPRSYQAMLIEKEGGNPADYFVAKDGDITDYTSLVLKKDDLDTAKDLILKSLTSKGVEVEDANDLITVYTDRNKLFEEGSKALDGLKADQVTREKQVVEAEKARQEDIQQTMSAFSKEIDNEISTGLVGAFNIPKGEAQEFTNFVKENVSFNNGKFFTSKEVSKENIKDVLGSLFFDYKKGNLDSLVKTKVKAENVKKLVIASRSSNKVKGNRDEGGKKTLRMGDY